MHTIFEHLERFVDEQGLHGVVNLLAKVASAKAEHIQHNWQDRTSAAYWDRAAGNLYKLEDKLRKDWHGAP